MSNEYQPIPRRCIAKLAQGPTSRCSAGELTSLDTLGKTVLLYGGGSLLASEIVRITYGQFDKPDTDFMVCDAHETECLRKAAGARNQSCAMPEAISLHPGSARAALRALTYSSCKAIYKEHGLLLPPGKRKRCLFVKISACSELVAK